MRVVTYNIRGALGMDGIRSLDRIAAAIRPLAPDVVCLQEVHRLTFWGGMQNQPAAIGRLLGMRVEFLSTFPMPLAGFGIAIASRYPITSVSRQLLPSLRERRGSLEVMVAGDLGPTRIFCTHLGLDEAERLRHAETVAGAIERKSGHVVVAGDFNEGGDGRVVKLFADRCGLVDAGEASDLPTYPSDAPQTRIDFVLHSPDLSCKELFVAYSQASDHRPVLAVLGAPERHQG